MAWARYSAFSRVERPCSLLRSMLNVARRQSRYALRNLSKGASFAELKPIKRSAYYQAVFQSRNNVADRIRRSRQKTTGCVEVHWSCQSYELERALKSKCAVVFRLRNCLGPTSSIMPSLVSRICITTRLT